MTSEAFGLRFDHLGLATRTPETTLQFLQGLGYRIPAPVYDPLQRAHLVYCSSDSMPAVEVIYAADAEGPLEAILATQPVAIYHQCYRSASLSHSLAAFKAAGHRVMQVSAGKPAVLFGGLTVSFHLVKAFGLIEIIEDPQAFSEPSHP